MKVLVISLAGIGDTLLATPLLRALRQCPQVEVIDVMTRWSGARDLLIGNPCVNRVHQKDIVKDSYASNLQFLNSLRRERYDVSINTHPQGKREYRYIARFIGANLRLSHRYENWSWIDRFLVNRSIDQDYSIHTIDNNLRLFPLIGLPEPKEPLDCELYFSAEEEEWARKFIHSRALTSSKLLGVQVGSGKTKNLMLKRWPLDHFTVVIRSVLAKYPDVRVLLFGGPDEKDDNERLLRNIDDARLLPVESRTMKEAVALLRHCHIFVSVDNVFMHLAAAVKVPDQIVIESPTFNKTIEPYHQRFRLVPNPMVAGRNLDYYRYDGRDVHGGTEHLLACMRSITPDAVLEAIHSAVRPTGRKD